MLAFQLVLANTAPQSILQEKDHIRSIITRLISHYRLRYYRPGSSSTGEILPALRAACNQGAIRLLDLLFIQKDARGSLHIMQTSDLTKEEKVRFGILIGTLLGMGAGTVAGDRRGGVIDSRIGAVGGAFTGMKVAIDAFAQDEYGVCETDIQAFAHRIPNGTAAALVLFEHHWAVTLKEAVSKAQGKVLADGFVIPETLVSLGARLETAVYAAEMAETHM